MSIPSTPSIESTVPPPFDRTSSFRMILRTLVVPTGLAMIVSIIGASFTLMLPNLYKADVKLLPKDPSMDRGLAALSAFVALGGAGGLGGAGTDPDAINVDIIQSRWMFNKLLDAQYDFSFKEHFIGSTQNRTQTLAQFFNTTNRERAEKKLKEMLTIRRDLKTGVTSIEVESPSPELSMQVANNVAINLNEFLNQRSQENGRAKVRFTEQMLLEARRQLAEVEARKLQFLKVNLNASYSSDPIIAAKYVDLGREYSAASSIVQALENNKIQALLQEKNNVPSLMILDWARIPATKSGPYRSTLVLALFFLTGGATWMIRNWQWVNQNLRVVEGLTIKIQPTP